ncbi:MAG: glycosyltransferase family 4 protein [Promethearchaeati archaeon]
MNKDKLGPYSKKLLSYSAQKDKITFDEKITELKILRVLCQRPYFTGSGINLVNLIQKTIENKLDQCIILGQPAGEPNPMDNLINASNIFPVTFLNPKNPQIETDIPFIVAGMSDEMPYESTKFSTFNEEMLEHYLEGFSKHLKAAIFKFEPNLIHSHHLWLITALCRVLFPNIPLLATSHNTALRQMVLSPHITEFIKKPIQDVDAIAVIDENQQKRIEDLYEFPRNSSHKEKFFHIGQAINTRIFSPPRHTNIVGKNTPLKIVYVGKLSYSKGLPELIKTFKQVSKEIEIPLQLYIIGSGKGKQKENIIKMGKKNGENIFFLGQLDQEKLANYLRESELFVLPSFYDGFPKVLLEALSSGCRAIITDLPGIKSTLFKKCGPSNIIQFLSLPEMKSIDEPVPEEIPSFIENLKSLIKKQLEEIASNKFDYKYANKVRDEFGWDKLFQIYLEKYKELAFR